MSIMGLEIHGQYRDYKKLHVAISTNHFIVNTREKFVPDPLQDPIVSIFWCLQSNEDREDLKNNGMKDGSESLNVSI